MNTMQDIKVKVWGQDGMTMEFTTPWDADLDEWGQKLRLILTFLQFGVDEIVINPGSDDPQGEEEL